MSESSILNKARVPRQSQLRPVCGRLQFAIAPMARLHVFICRLGYSASFSIILFGYFRPNTASHLGNMTHLPVNSCGVKSRHLHC
jgi:hypothetical protein